MQKYTNEKGKYNFFYQLFYDKEINNQTKKTWEKQGKIVRMS